MSDKNKLLKYLQESGRIDPATGLLRIPEDGKTQKLATNAPFFPSSGQAKGYTSQYDRGYNPFMEQQGISLQDNRARAQGVADRYGNGLMKMTASGTVAFAETFNVLAHLIPAIVTWDGSKLYDNPIGHMLDDLNEMAQEQFPHYYTQEQQEEGMWGKGVNNFISDSFASGLGYTLGSLFSGMGATKLLKLSKFANQAKVAEVVSKAGNIEKALEKSATSIGRWSAIDQASVGFLAGAGEAALEARMTQENIMGRLEPLIASGELTREEAEKAAHGGAGTNFFANLIINGGLNYIAFKNILAPKATERSMRGVKNRIIKDSKDNLVDASKQGKLAGAKRFANDFAPSGRTGLAEAAQEGSQYWSNESLSDIFEKSATGDLELMDVLTDLQKGLEETFTTNEGQESMIIGGLVGMLVGGFGGVRKAKAERKIREDNTEKYIQAYQTLKDNPDFQQFAQNFKTHAQALDYFADANRAKEVGDELAASVNYTMGRATYIQGHVMKGTSDALKDSVKDSLELEDAEFKKQFGYEESYELKDGEKREKVNEVIQAIEKVESFNDTLDTVFPLNSFPEEKRAAAVQYKARLGLMSTAIDEIDRHESDLSKKISKSILDLDMSGLSDEENEALAGLTEYEFNRGHVDKKRRDEYRDKFNKDFDKVIKLIAQKDRVKAAEILKNVHDLNKFATTREHFIDGYNELTKDKYVKDPQKAEEKIKSTRKETKEEAPKYDENTSDEETLSTFHKEVEGAGYTVESTEEEVNDLDGGNTIVDVNGKLYRVVKRNDKWAAVPEDDPNHAGVPFDAAYLKKYKPRVVPKSEYEIILNERRLEHLREGWREALATFSQDRRNQKETILEEIKKEEARALELVEEIYEKENLISTGKHRGINKTRTEEAIQALWDAVAEVDVAIEILNEELEALETIAKTAEELSKHTDHLLSGDLSEVTTVAGMQEHIYNRMAEGLAEAGVDITILPQEINRLEAELEQLLTKREALLEEIDILQELLDRDAIMRDLVTALRDKALADVRIGKVLPKGITIKDGQLGPIYLKSGPNSETLSIEDLIAYLTYENLDNPVAKRLVDKMVKTGALEGMQPEELISLLSTYAMTEARLANATERNQKSQAEIHEAIKLAKEELDEIKQQIGLIKGVKLFEFLDENYYSFLGELRAAYKKLDKASKEGQPSEVNNQVNVLPDGAVTTEKTKAGGAIKMRGDIFSTSSATVIREDGTTEITENEHQLRWAKAMAHINASNQDNYRIRFIRPIDIEDDSELADLKSDITDNFNGTKFTDEDIFTVIINNNTGNMLKVGGRVAFSGLQFTESIFDSSSIQDASTRTKARFLWGSIPQVDQIAKETTDANKDEVITVKGEKATKSEWVSKVDELYAKEIESFRENHAKFRAEVKTKLNNAVATKKKANVELEVFSEIGRMSPGFEIKDDKLKGLSVLGLELKDGKTDGFNFRVSKAAGILVNSQQIEARPGQVYAVNDKTGAYHKMENRTLEATEVDLAIAIFRAALPKEGGFITHVDMTDKTNKSFMIINGTKVGANEKNSRFPLLPDGKQNVSAITNLIYFGRTNSKNSNNPDTPYSTIGEIKIHKNTGEVVFTTMEEAPKVVKVTREDLHNPASNGYQALKAFLATKYHNVNAGILASTQDKTFLMPALNPVRGKDNLPSLSGKFTKHSSYGAYLYNKVFKTYTVGKNSPVQIANKYATFEMEGNTPKVQILNPGQPNNEPVQKAVSSATAPEQQVSKAATPKIASASVGIDDMVVGGVYVLHTNTVIKNSAGKPIAAQQTVIAKPQENGTVILSDSKILNLEVKPGVIGEQYVTVPNDEETFDKVKKVKERVGETSPVSTTLDGELIELKGAYGTPTKEKFVEMYQGNSNRTLVKIDQVEVPNEDKFKTALAKKKAKEAEEKLNENKKSGGAKETIVEAKFTEQGTSFEIEIQGENKPFLLTWDSHNPTPTLWGKKQADGTYTTTEQFPNKEDIQALVDKYVPKNLVHLINEWTAANKLPAGEVLDAQEKAEKKIKAEVKKTKSGKTKPPGIDRRKTNQDYNKEDVDTAVAWLKDKLGLSEKDVVVVEGLLSRGAFGRFLEDGRILLSDIMEEGTQYHEAFHRVFRMFLTDAERSLLYKEFLKREGSSALLASASETYPDYTEAELIEEVLAEEFREAVLSDQLKGTTKKDNFFTRIVNFFKKLFNLLTGTKVQNTPLASLVYSRILEGKYQKGRESGQPLSGNVDKRSLKTKTDTLEGEDVFQLMQGVHLVTMQFLRKHDTLTSDDAYHNILGNSKNLGEVYEQKFTINSSEGQIENTVKEYIEDMLVYHMDTNEASLRAYKFLTSSGNQGWEKMAAYHREYLAKFGVDVRPGLEGELEQLDPASERFKVLNQQNVKDAAFNKSAMEFDPANSVSRSIRLLLSSFTESRITEKGDLVPVENSLGLYIPINYVSTFNFLGKNLAGVPTGIDNYINKIGELADSTTNLSRKKLLLELHKMLKSYKEAGKTKLLTDFIKSFGNYIYDYSLLRVRDNNIYRIDTGAEGSAVRILADWKTALSVKEITQEVKDKINDTKNVSLEEFQSLIGMNLTFDLDEKLPNTDRTAREALGDIREVIKRKNLKDLRIIYSQEKKGEADILGTITSLAKREAQENTSENLAHFNGEGNLIHSLSQNSTLTLTATLLNSLNLENQETTEEREENLNENLPHLLNAYTGNSLILNAFLGSVTPVNLKIGVAEEFKDDEGNISSTNKLSPFERTSQMITNTLNGRYHFMQTGDRKVNNYFTLRNGELFVRTITNDNITNIFKGYVLDEIAAIKAAKNYVGVINQKNATKFRFFSFLPDKVQSSLTSLEGRELNALIDELVMPLTLDYLSDKFEAFSKYAKDLGIGEVYNNTDHLGIAEELKKEFGSPETILQTAYYNMVIANIEQTKIFFGDIAFFEDANDLFKRLSMFNSTRKPVTYDLNDSIQSEDAKDGYIKDDYSVYTEQVILDEATTASTEYLTQYKKVVRKALPALTLSPEEITKQVNEYVDNAYGNFKEADGLSYINIFAYRALLRRTSDWTDEHKKIFDKVKNGENISPDELYKFTMLKPQSTGYFNGFSDLSSFKAVSPQDRLFIPAGRKTAYMPLIPSLLPKNSTLSKLASHMESNRIDIVHMSSSAKYGSYEPINVYDSEGNFEAPQGNISSLDIRFLSIQLDIHNKPDTTITKSTQSSKIVLSNLFENGVFKYPGDPLEQVVEDYLNVDEELVMREYNSILDMIDLERVEATSGPKDSDNDVLTDSYYVINNIDKFISILKETVRITPVAENVLDSIESLRKKNGYYVIDSVQSKQKIEQVLMSIIKNRITYQKRSGTTLPLSSVKGYETEPRTRSKGKLVASNELQSYRIDENGDVIPGEVMIPLPADLAKWAANKYGSIEKGLEAINNNLSFVPDPFWAEFINFKGLRIPNQSLASNDPLIVKKFLHPALSTIVVPPLLVPKTGADFDIDKLYNYMKNYVITPDGPMILPSNITSGEELAKAAVYGKSHKELDAIITNLLPLIHKDNAAELVETYNNFSKYDAENSILSKFMANDPQYLKLMKTRNSTVDELIKLRKKKGEYKSQIASLLQTLGLVDFEISKRFEEINPDNSIHEVKNKSNEYSKSLISKLGALLDAAIEEEAITDTNFKFLTRGSLENRSLNNELRLLTDSKVAPNLLLPVVDFFLKNLATKLGGQDENISYSDVLDPTTNIEKFDDFNSGVEGISVLAVHNVSHVRAQLSGLKHKTHSWFNDHNGEMGHTYTQDGYGISEILGMLQTSQMDIGKDPYSRKLGVVSDTVSMAGYLIRRGVSPEEVFTFLSHPIVIEYIHNLRKNNSVLVKGTDYASRPNNQKGKSDASILNLIKSPSKTGAKLDKRALAILTLSEQKVSGETVGDMSIFTPGLERGKLTLDNLTSIKDEDYVLVLDAFLSIMEDSSEFTEMIINSNPDTQNDKSMTETKESLKKVVEFHRNPNFENYAEYMDIYAYPYQLGRELQFNLLAETKLSGTPKYFKAIDSIYKALGFNEVDDLRTGGTKLQRIMSKQKLANLGKALEDDLALFAVYNAGIVDTEMLRNLLNSSNPDTVAKKIHKITNDSTNPLYNNPFLKQLLPIMNNKGLAIDNVSLFKTNIIAHDVDRLSEAFYEIKEKNPILAEDLIKLDIAQAGFSTTPLTYRRIIPTDILNDYVQEAIDKTTNGELDMNMYQELFYRNNPKYLPKYGDSMYRRKWDKTKNRFSVLINGNVTNPLGNSIYYKNYDPLKAEFGGDGRLNQSNEIQPAQQNNEVNIPNYEVVTRPTKDIGKSKGRTGNFVEITTPDNYRTNMSAYMVQTNDDGKLFITNIEKYNEDSTFKGFGKVAYVDFFENYKNQGITTDKKLTADGIKLLERLEKIGLVYKTNAKLIDDTQVSKFYNTKIYEYDKPLYEFNLNWSRSQITPQLTMDFTGGVVPTVKIISGFQTGVDTLGLEVGQELGIETGGTATPGFYREGGKNSELGKKYGVNEISSEMQKGKTGREFYLPRTEENVKNSNGTVYFATEEDSAGRKATERYAKKHSKPFLLNPTGQQLKQWLVTNNIEILNVAGNRGSKLSSNKAAEIKSIMAEALGFKQIPKINESNLSKKELIDDYVNKDLNILPISISEFNKLSKSLQQDLENYLDFNSPEEGLFESTGSFIIQYDGGFNLYKNLPYKYQSLDKVELRKYQVSSDLSLNDLRTFIGLTYEPYENKITFETKKATTGANLSNNITKNNNELKKVTFEEVKSVTDGLDMMRKKFKSMFPDQAHLTSEEREKFLKLVQDGRITIHCKL